MTAKEYLSRIRNMDDAVRREEDELARLEAELASIRAVDYSRERVQTSGDPEAAFIAAIDRILELQADRMRDRERLITVRSEVIMRLEDMDNAAYSELLYLRYVGGETLESAASIMGYSYDRVRHMHGEALEEFAKKYEKILENM